MAKKTKFYENPKIAKAQKDGIYRGIKKYIADGVNRVNNIEKNKLISGTESEVEKVVKEIAGVHMNQIYDVQDSLAKSTLIMGSMNKKHFNDPDDVIKKTNKATIETLHKNNFFQDIEHAFGTKKVQSGNELFKNTIRYDQSQNVMTNRSFGKQNTVNWDRQYKNLLRLEEIKSGSGHLITYDVETLSGLNRYGHNSLEHITEISATVHEVAGGKMSRARRVDSVLGFDDSQYTAAINRLEEIRKRGINSLADGSSDKVFFDRMNIYGSSLIEAGEGFEHHVTESVSIEDINASIERAKKGIENLRDVGKKQESWVMNNVSPTTKLGDYQKKYVQEVSELISTGQYKGQTYSNYVALGQNSAIFDNPKIGLFGGKPIDPSNHLDMYQLNMVTQDLLGAQRMYDGQAKSSGKYGRATQENLSSAHGYKIQGKAAHIAMADQEELARMMMTPMFQDSASMALAAEQGVYGVSGNSYLEVLLNNAREVHEQMSQTASAYTGKDQLFYMDYTQQKNRGDKSGALSFSFDPVTGKYKTFDGFEVSGDGVNSTGYNQYGARKGTLATHEIIRVDNKYADVLKNIDGLSAEQSKMIHQELANANHLYLIKTKEYFDRDALEKKMGKEGAEFFLKNQRTNYIIETNPERLGANLGIHVGDLSKGNVVSVKEDALKSLGMSAIDSTGSAITTSAVEDANAIMQELKDRTLNRAINDSAAREIRELDYLKVSKLRKYRADHSKTIKPIATHALQYAEAVAAGKPLNLGIQDVLGWVDPHTKETKINSERIQKAVALENYVEKMEPVFQRIEGILDEKYGKFDFSKYDKSSPSSREALIKREMGFKQLLSDYMEAAAGVTPGSAVTAAELNKIDFRRSDVFTSDWLGRIGTSANAQMDEFVSLDLNNNNSLLSMFFGNKFENVEDRVVKNSAAGWTALQDAYDAFKYDERFSGDNGFVFSGMSVNQMRKDGYSVLQANDMMMERIRDYTSNRRELDGDSMFGILHLPNKQNVIDVNDIESYANLAPERMDSILKEAKANLRDSNKIQLLTASANRETTSVANQRTINTLVNDYFMDYTSAEFERSLEGYTEEQVKVLRLQDKLNRRTAHEYATDLVESIAGEDNLAYMITQTKDGRPILSLHHDGKLTELKAQRFSINKGMSTSMIGGEEYVNRLAFGFSSKTTNIPYLTTTAEKARLQRSMHHNIKWSQDRGGSIADGIISTVKSRSRQVAEATTRVEFSNGQLFAQSFMIDTNDMIKMLPRFQENGTLETIERTFGIEQSSRSAIAELTRKVANGEYDLGNKSFSNISSLELNHFMPNYYRPLLEALQGEIEIPGISPKEIEEYRGILGYIGQKSKTVPFRSGHDSLDKTYYMDAFGAIDNEHRPPVTQLANSVLYDKKEVQERVNALNKRGIYAKSGPTATNSLAEKFLYNNEGKAGTSTSGLTMKFLQVDSTTMQNRFLAEKQDGKAMSRFLESRNYSKQAAEEIYKIATSASTYEQQGLINSRVSDTSFHKFNTQKVNASKQMILDMRSDLETITYVKNATKLQFSINKNGEISYQNGVLVRAGDTLGRFGNEEFSSINTARYDGIFRGRFFDDHGNALSATKINELTRGLQDRSEETVREYLANNFTYKYELMPTKEPHGMKVFLGASEKVTTSSAKMGIGTLDKGLVEELKKFDLDLTAGSVTYAGYLYGDVKELLDQSEEGKALFKRILNERHAFSDYMQEIDEFRGVGIFSAVNAGKHGSSSMMMHSFMTGLQEGGHITEDNMTKIFGKGNYRILKDGRVELGSYNKVNLNFDEGSDLKKVWDATTSAFNKGRGYVNVVQGHDDISGTYAGIARDLSNEINLKDRSIRKMEAQADRMASYEKLIQEKEELVNLINNLDGNAKNKKQLTLEKISEAMEIANQDFIKVNNQISAAKELKSSYYKDIQELNEVIAGQFQRKQELIEQVIQGKDVKKGLYGEITSVNNNIQELIGKRGELNNLFAKNIDQKNRNFAQFREYGWSLDPDGEIHQFLSKQKDWNIQQRERIKEWQKVVNGDITDQRELKARLLEEMNFAKGLQGEVYDELGFIKGEIGNSINAKREARGAMASQSEMLTSLYEKRLGLLTELRGDRSVDLYSEEDLAIRNGYIKKIAEIEVNISKARKGLDGFDANMLGDLKLERTLLERQANAMDAFKGVKFSEAMGRNLDRTVFNKDLIGKLRSELDESTFQRYFGYAMDGNVIRGEYLGKSMAAPITGNLREQLTSQMNSLKLSEVMDGGRLQEQYGYLVDAVKASGGDIGNVSVSSAETMYSYAQGLKAMAFNEQGTYGARQDLLKSSLGAFNEIGYADLELDIGGQGRQIVNSELNPYTNNLLINTGLDGKYAELAIARMPEVHAGDTIIKKEHVKRLSTLKEQLAQYHGTDDEKDKAKYLGNAQSTIDKIISLQKRDVTSKEGLAREGTEFRMQQSFFGKASGINVNAYDGNTSLFGAIKGDMDSIERGKILATLEGKNARLVGREFDGKSLLEHYGEGRLIDSAFVNRSTFENLGYFDKDYLEQTFSNISGDYASKLKEAGYDLSSASGREGAMEHLLRTEGDSFISVRYPEIMEGSDKFSMLYLDDAVKDNEIMVFGATGMSAKLDHDGDSFAAARVMNANGKSKLTSAITGESGDLTTMAFDSGVMTRAATSNKYWESEVRSQIAKESNFASSIDGMRDLAGKRFIGGSVYTSKLYDENLTLEELHGLQKRYEEVLKISPKDYAKMSDNDLINRVVDLSGGKDQEAALNEYMAAWAYSDNQDMIVAKVYQNAVGETNVTAQKVKSAITDMMDKTADDYEYKQQLLSDFLYRAEEGAISSKTSIEGLEPERAKIWNEAVMGTLKGENVTSNKEIMTKWLQDNVQNEAFIESYYARSSHFSGYVNDKYNINSFHDFKAKMSESAFRTEVANKMTTDFVDMVADYSGDEGMIKALESARISVSQAGVSSSAALNPFFISGADSNMKRFYDTGHQLFGDNFGNITMVSPASSSAFRSSIEETISAAEDSIGNMSTKGTFESIIGGVEDIANSVKGKKIAMGAVGIAAGIMMAGFVGGRPRPADVHAMEEATDYPQQGLQLADPNLTMGNGNGGGYVININARTGKGRDNAVQALQQAIQSGTSSTINVAMNITNDYGNINDRAIEDAILGAF